MAYKYDPTFQHSLGTTKALAHASSSPFMVSGLFLCFLSPLLHASLSLPLSPSQGPVDIYETPTTFVWVLDCAGLSSKVCAAGVLVLSHKNLSDISPLNVPLPSRSLSLSRRTCTYA